ESICKVFRHFCRSQFILQSEHDGGHHECQPTCDSQRSYAKVESLSIAELNDFVITAPSQACQPELECFYGKHLLIGINVMAELDFPRHAESWGTGYPDLWPSPSCREPLDVTKNFTFDVIAGILAGLLHYLPHFGSTM
ncbi:unnamed protein product, partial [Brassica oleracea var. botrytis]